MRRIESVRNSVLKGTNGKPFINRFSVLCLFMILIIFIGSGCEVARQLSPQRENGDSTILMPEQPTKTDNLTTVPRDTTPTTSIVTTASNPISSETLPPKTQGLAKEPTAPISIPLQLTNTPDFTPLNSSDLLYISKGHLMRWDHLTGYSGILTTNVSDYAASDSGSQIALLRTRGITANGLALYDLAILDLDTKLLKTLIQSITKVEALSISPDGQWITYIQPDQGNQIFILATQSHGLPTVLGSCNPNRDDFSTKINWSPDSKYVVWSDLEGVWLSHLKKNTLRLVQSNHVSILNPQGESIEIEVMFQDLLWSPNGRYVLAKTIPDASRVGWYSIIDTKRERLVQVPDSYVSDLDGFFTIWLQDGSIITTQHNVTIGSGVPTLKHWLIFDTHEKILVQNQLIQIPLEYLPIQNHKYAFGINWLTQNSDGNLTFEVSSPGSAAAPRMFSLDLVENKIEKFLELPIHPKSIKIAPDGGGVLIIGEEDQLFFVTLLDGKSRNLRPLFGSDAQKFNWLPPTPRY